MPNNHVIDPTYFYDAIEEFAFDYYIYVMTGETVDDYGMQKHTYKQETIRGSLQTQGTSRKYSKDGNLDDCEYKFYCKSLYRINLGDFIEYQHKLLYVYAIHDYDEYGVREATLKMVDLMQYQDLADYLEYINGEKIV